MNLSVVIPCYNEIRTLQTVISAVAEVIGPDGEIIVVDDCSTDGTRDFLRNQMEGSNVRVLYHAKNMGKGAALRTGFNQATRDIVIVQDADLEYDPGEFQRVIDPILRNEADVVYGSRFKVPNPIAKHQFWHHLGNRTLTAMSNLLNGLDLTDMETCYKAFRREIIQSIEIEENRFGVEPEITAKIARGDHRISEVDIGYRRRSYADGKKIGWKDGVSAIRCIIKYNLFR